MQPWEGKRSLAVVTASMNSTGSPEFVYNQVEVTHEEYENGIHFIMVEDLLADDGYEEPWVHFDEVEAPSFLIAAVKEAVAQSTQLPEPITELTEEES